MLERSARHATIHSPSRSTALTIDGSSPGSSPAAFGPFRVLHQVGAGTTGLVFRAHDPVEGRLVAIKAFRLDLTPERAGELADALEVLAGRGLSHPSIAAPIGAGVEDGIAWFAQAYVPAESLDSALRQYGPPPVADVLTIVTQLAGALDFAAAAGVLHGSLHPRDVLVAPGETHLVDLGVAAALEACGVRAPVRRPYNAPERATGRPISRAGDIFALGAIAFELLSGQPVTGAGDDGIVTLPDVPGANREALLETFSFALALAPDERYATALAFAAPLKKALGDALTRPAAPRKRRTTRPPEALLPIDAVEPEPLADVALPESPAIEQAAGHPDSGAPGFGSERRAASAVPPVPVDEYDRAASAPPPRPTPRRPARADVTEDVAPAYLSGPSEPAPSAPAVEPIAEPGEPGPLGHHERDAFLDRSDNLSPVDALDLYTATDPMGLWQRPDDTTPYDASAAATRSAAPAGPRYPIAEPADRIADDGPPHRSDARHPLRSEYRTIDDAIIDEHVIAPVHSPWPGLAAMLLVGLVAGLAGGWFLFSRPSAGSNPRGATEQTAGGANAPGATHPREWTDDAVRQPDGAATASSTPASQTRQTAAAAAARPSAARVPAPRAETTSPEPPVRGRLVVRTRPAGARVEVEGRSRGESPATVTDLAFGQHTVRVSHDGYATEQRRVALSARHPAQTVDVTLKRNAPPTPPAPARSAREQPATFVGTVIVDSRPVGAKVFIDGKGAGITPVTIPDVRAGSHVVRLEMTNYRRWSSSIRVVAGERERVAASLEEETLR